MESPDSLIVFEQSGQAACEHSFRLIFIELRQHERLRKLETCSIVGSAYKPQSVFLTGTGTDAGAVKDDLASCPMLAEKTRLPFSEL